MESQNVLGLFFGKLHATAVCVNKGAVSGAVTLSLEADQKGDLQTLTHRLAEQCKAQNFKFTEVSVALDSAWFMQHNVRSEFKQAKQIGATVRFDTEEVVASDISNLSVAFEIIKSDDKGSTLNVFTADHDPLSQILLTLQSHALDPIRILPDVGCLTGLVQQNLEPDTLSNASALICLVSRNNGHFLKYDQENGLHPVRTFLVGSQANLTDCLVRESFTTMASVGAAGVPGAGIVTLAMVLTATGIPAVGIALILGMDRVLDMFRTAVNVTGDLAVTSAMAASEGEDIRILSTEEDKADPDRGFERRLEREEHAVPPED